MTDRLRHVTTHLTPLALVVVVPGLFLAPLSRAHITLVLVLLAYTVLTNCLSGFRTWGQVELVTKVRVLSNYVVNIALLWVLYAAWPIIWLLLLLMAVGPALYQRSRDAILSGAYLAAMLLAIHAFRGEHTALAWTEAGVKACTLVVLSAFVSGLPEDPENG